MSSADPKSRGVVLIVDDDDDIRDEVRATLEAHGYLVLEAGSGGDALGTLRLHEPPAIDVILLDLVMPDVSGWDLVGSLIRDPMLRHIPIIVASAVPVHRDTSGIASTVAWLAKPFGESALLTAVEKAIEEMETEDPPGEL